MKHTYKNILQLACIIAVISFSSCKKTSTTPASIQGTWALNSLMQVVNYNNMIIHNDTVTYPTGQTVYTFEPNGYFVHLTASGISGGLYTVSGNILTTIDTPSSFIYRFNMLTLTEQTLVIQRIDTTVTGPNTSISTSTQSFTR
jgi:hypothetical protein